MSATLAHDLRGRDDASLAALLRARPDLLSPVPADLAALAARATTRASVLRALDALDHFRLQVLEAVCVLAEPVDPSALPEAVGAPTDDALASLLSRALVFRGSTGLLYVPLTVREVIGSPAGLGPPLATLLGTYGPRRREQLARDLGGAPDEVLTDVTRLEALLATAAPAARNALDALTWGPPTGRLDDALREVTAESARTPVEWLLAHGLLIASDPHTVVLPREVALRLRDGRIHRDPQPDLPEPVTSPVDRARLDRSATAAVTTVVRHVEDLLELWAAAPPRVLRSGGIGVRDRSRTATALDVDEPMLSLLAEVAYAAGLLAPGDEPEEGLAEVWLPTPAYDHWTDLAVADRWLALVGAWLASPRVIGLAGSVDSRGRTLVPLGPDLERGIAPELRRAVLRDLAALPDDAETDAQSLTARLRWRAPRRAGRLHDDLVTWTLAEAGSLGLAAGGALATYARLLVDGDAAGARAALHPHLPVPLDHVLLQADLTAIAPGPLEPHLARQLRTVADVESTGGATVYRFSASSIRRAFDAGWSADELLRLLTTRSTTPVPQPLAYLVEDVGRRHGQVRVGAAGAYVRCDDETTVGELLGDRRAASLRLRRIAGTVLAAAAAPDLVLERLRELGYAPAAEGGDGDLLVHRPEASRSSPRPSLRPVDTATSSPTDALLAAAVAVVRAGDRAEGAPTSRPVADVLAILMEAAATGTPVWIGYVDAEGRATSRVVEPVRVQGGALEAYDHLRADQRTFAIHRITGVSPVDQDVREAGA